MGRKALSIPIRARNSCEQSKVSKGRWMVDGSEVGDQIPTGLRGYGRKLRCCCICYCRDVNHGTT